MGILLGRGRAGMYIARPLPRCPPAKAVSRLPAKLPLAWTLSMPHPTQVGVQSPGATMVACISSQPRQPWARQAPDALVSPLLHLCGGQSNRPHPTVLWKELNV